MLPAVGIIVTERGRIGESERKTEQLTKHRGERTEERRVTENALEQTRKKRDNLKKTLAEDETKQEKLNTRLRELRRHPGEGQAGRGRRDARSSGSKPS